MGDKAKKEEVKKMGEKTGIFGSLFGKKTEVSGNTAPVVPVAPEIPTPRVPDWLAAQQGAPLAQQRAVVADVLGNPDSGAHMSGKNVRVAAEGERATADKVNTGRLRKLTGRG